MFESLTENLGDKIKKVAVATFVVEAIGVIAAGFFLMYTASFLLGLGTIVGGLIACVITFWFMYAFGDMAEQMADTWERVYKLQREIEQMKKGENKSAPVAVTRTSTGTRATAPVAAGKWVCVCGRENEAFASSCVCGITKHEAKQKLAQKSE